MIDIWKIISLMFPFTEIILHSISHVWTNKSKNIVKSININNESEELDYDEKISKIFKNVATYGLPISYTVFLLVYFCYSGLVPFYEDEEWPIGKRGCSFLSQLIL